MTAPDNPHLASLRDWGLISQEQHDRASAPEVAARLRDAQSEVHLLYMMLAMGVVDEHDFDLRAAAVRDADPRDGSFDEPLAILAAVEAAMAEAVAGMNRPHMDALLALSLIDAAQHVEGCKVRPANAEGMIDGPARALMVLAARGIVTEAQFETMTAAARADASASGSPSQRSQVVLDAAQRYHDLVGTYAKAMAGGALKGVGLVLLVVFGVVGLLVWVLR